MAIPVPVNRDRCILTPLITPPARRALRSFKSAPFLFFPRVESRATAHVNTAATHHLNPFYSRICQQNTHFNMYTEISKRKQGSLCKNFHQRCFETTNF